MSGSIVCQDLGRVSLVAPSVEMKPCPGFKADSSGGSDGVPIPYWLGDDGRTRLGVLMVYQSHIG